VVSHIQDEKLLDMFHNKLNHLS